jgi:2-polyprenyl-6-methoxyphenol hydroxylase-like FAD-dependent oxidoreductase
MLLRNIKTAIIGGGPGGLTLARLLQLKGAEVMVYERDRDRQVRSQGATLDLHEESGLKALERAKLLDEFQRLHRPDAGRLRIVDANAVIQMDDSDGPLHEESRPEIDRAPLRDMIIDSLDTQTISWGSQFMSLEKQNDRWQLQFKDGTSVYADLVVAADGANSKVRPYISNVPSIYSGVTIVEGNIYNAEQNAPTFWQLTNGGKVFALGNGQSIILSAKGEGSLSFYTGCKVPEHWVNESGIDFDNKEQVFDWFKGAFASWDKQWHELFASNSIWLTPRPQYHYPLYQTWPTQSNLTMIGDAAHRMPPYAGEGVNQAMQDAYELAECLTEDSFSDIPTAISHFEKNMQQRVSQVTKDTMENTELFHSDDGLVRLLQMFRGFQEQ